jgi:hypothetical protein
MDNMTCINHRHVMAPFVADLGVFGARGTGRGRQFKGKKFALAMTSQAGTSWVTWHRQAWVTRDVWVHADDVEIPGARQVCAKAMMEKPINGRAVEERFAASGA